MKRTTGNLWTMYAQVKVIPTNGVYRDAGGVPPMYQAVMGKGVAFQARILWPGLTIELGNRLQKYGNRVYLFRVPEPLRQKLQCLYVMTMPTKEQYRENAIMELLETSANQMHDLVTAVGLKDILLPAVGTGCGNLSLQDVTASLDPILDDRFTLVELPLED